MSPAKRISKKQIKQDSFVTTALKASEYFQKNKNYFYMGLGVLVVIILAIYLIGYSSSQKAINSENLFAEGQLAAAMGQWEQSIISYRQLVDEYSATDFAGRACYYVAKTYYEHDQFDSATVYFEKYIANYKKQPLLIVASYVGSAGCYEHNDDYAKAGDCYFKAAETANSDTDSPEYYMEAGRTYARAGLKDKAEQAYQVVIDQYQKSANYNLARKKLAEIQYAQN